MGKYIILSVLIFAFLFMVARSLLMDYELLEPLKRRLKDFFWLCWAKRPPLKPTYIVFAVLIGVFLFILFIALYYQLFNIISGRAKTTISTIDSNFALAFLGTVSGGVALFTGYMAILRSGTNERQTYTAEEGLITDRINKATEGLGKNNDNGKPVVEVRLGALYALERIAQDSQRDHIQIMEILCAYVRYNSPLKSKNAKPKKLREDIHTAVTIIGRRHGKFEWESRKNYEMLMQYRLDLSHCDLHGIKLEHADLSKANLEQTNFSGAEIYHSKLSYSKLYKANMSHVRLTNVELIRAELKELNLNEADIFVANLKHADLGDAKIIDAKITGINFSYANLYDANLRGTYINKSDVERADFQFVKTETTFTHEGDFSDCLNLTQDQLDAMFCGYDVKIPDGLDKPLHWPTVDLCYDDFMKEYWKWHKKNKLLLTKKTKK